MILTLSGNLYEKYTRRKHTTKSDQINKNKAKNTYLLFVL